MIVVFNKKGITKEQLDSYGNLPRVGSQAFQIFAYFDDVEMSNYGSAYIKLYRPDYSGSAYPILFMTLADLTFHTASNVSSNYLRDGQTYRGFLFDFSKVKDTKGTETLSDDTIVTLLDTPGQWKAVITLVSKTKVANVVGSISFNVGGVPSEDDDETEIDLDVVISTLGDALAEKLDTNSVYYVRDISGFEAKAEAGQLPETVFVDDCLVFDESNTSFYKINTVSENESNPGYVYCSNYTKFSIDVSNLVPYTGATRNIALGDHTLYLTKIIVSNNGTSNNTATSPHGVPNITITKDSISYMKPLSAVTNSLLKFPEMTMETVLGGGEIIGTQEWTTRNFVPLVPETTNYVDIGDSTHEFKDIYARNIKTSSPSLILEAGAGVSIKTIVNSNSVFLMNDQLTANRIVTFPDKAGTIALTDDCTKFYTHTIVLSAMPTIKTVKISLADGTITSSSNKPAFGIKSLSVVSPRATAYTSLNFEQALSVAATLGVSSIHDLSSTFSKVTYNATNNEMVITALDMTDITISSDSVAPLS